MTKCYRFESYKFMTKGNISVDFYRKGVHFKVKVCL